MKGWKKFALIGGGVVVLLAIVGFTVQQSRKGVVAVQTGKVIRENLSSVVTASGEIKPKVYVNIGAILQAKITRLYVKEGDHVKQGQLLASLDNIQPAADVAMTDAMLNASRMDADAAKAAVNTAAADLKQAQAENERATLDYNRNKALYDAQLISKADYDTKKAAYDTAAAQLNQSKAKLAQAKANLDSAEGHIGQNAASLRHADDVLSKTEYRAPFDGVVTNLPVREGETVVPGIQNSPGSTLMTVADTSLITAEVKVDESDIVNVQIGQPAEITTGFDTVFIGIETPDAAGLAECNKRQNQQRDLVADVKRIQRAGLQVQGGFIVGFDSDNATIFRRQLEFIQKSGIVTAMVGLLNALPGHQAACAAEERGPARWAIQRKQRRRHDQFCAPDEH